MSPLLKTSRRIVISLTCVLLNMTLAAAQTGSSLPEPDRPQPKTPEISSRANNVSLLANALLKSFVEGPGAPIRPEVLDKAYAIAVFPRVRKYSFFFVGKNSGTGLVSRRIPGGWSAPAYFKIDTYKFGPQYGLSLTDVVLLFMTPDAAEGLLGYQYQIGKRGKRLVVDEIGRQPYPARQVEPAALASFTHAGFTTAPARKDKGFKTTADVIAYTIRRGIFFAEFSARGIVIKPDNRLNIAAVEGLEAREILALNPQRALEVSPAVNKEFTAAITKAWPNDSETMRPRVYATVIRDPADISFDVEYCPTPCMVKKDKDTDEVIETTGQFKPVPKYQPEFFEIEPVFHWFKWTDSMGKVRAIYDPNCNTGCTVTCKY